MQDSFGLLGRIHRETAFGMALALLIPFLVFLQGPLIPGLTDYGIGIFVLDLCAGLCFLDASLRSRIRPVTTCLLGVVMLALAFAFYVFGERSERTFWSDVFPAIGLLMTLLFGGLLLLIALVRVIVDVVRRARNRGDSRCFRCGYDLTGNVSGVCSECGASTMAPLREGSIIDDTVSGREDQSVTSRARSSDG